MDASQIDKKVKEMRRKAQMTLCFFFFCWNGDAFPKKINETSHELLF